MEDLWERHQVLPILMIEDHKKWEEEIAAERERREREMDARVQEMARQMEMMRN